jgi:hypothetical protein
MNSCIYYLTEVVDLGLLCIIRTAFPFLQKNRIHPGGFFCFLVNKWKNINPPLISNKISPIREKASGKGD